MDNKNTRKPPAACYNGDLGDELMILSLPVIRTAEQLQIPDVLETADGNVQGRCGDFVIKTDKGEHFPIPQQIFYGTYQILGQVGTRYVCQRQLHVRRAWEATAIQGVEFYYQPNRGTTHGAKGSWVYQSDDDDYGLINVNEKYSAHLELGPVDELTTRNWAEDVLRTSWLTALLPPLLTLIALLAYTAAINEWHLAAGLLLGSEGMLLVGGVWLVWRARQQRWFLKSAVGSATRIAREFQLAVKMLGQNASPMFPSMALWRAAQMKSNLPVFTPEEVSDLKDKVYRISEEIEKETHRHHKHEEWGGRLAWGAAALIVICIVSAIITKSAIPEVAAILFPSIVASAHSYLTRRQTLKRVGAGKTFLSELKFVEEKLNALALGPTIDPNKIDMDQLAAILRVLCKAVAEHTQRELEFALREEPNLPL